ncbi:MAG: SDR family NAD(P)-dependent oxidoreductase, partial [Clostridia bacterium]|nr:SDR family NAD(P)-dependent oxidoreductase [Clostridia bacterium]
MKSICVITGASSGIGKEFFTQIVNDTTFTFDEIWVIARNREKLEGLSALTSIPVKAISLDLSLDAAYEEYRLLLEAEKPRVSLLINCSGFGKFESVEKIGYADNMNMIDLNVRATAALDM